MTGEEKYNINNLPETISPLDYQAKAYSGELPPIFVIYEKTPGEFAVKAYVIAVGEKQKQIVKEFDKLCAMSATSGEHLFNQVPINTVGAVTRSDWEFTGSTYSYEDPKILAFGKEISEKLGIPLYYQNAHKDNNYRLVKPSLESYKELQNL